MPIRSPVNKDHKPVIGNAFGQGWNPFPPYLYPYTISGTTGTTLHTGVDLNLKDNADWHLPVYAVDNLIIEFSGKGRGNTWGNLIIGRGIDPFGKVYRVRYAHIETVLVKAGQAVNAGEQIASVGDADGFYRGVAAHLHFDVSYTDRMINDLRGADYAASYWPNMDRAGLLNNFVDPVEWLVLMASAEQYTLRKMRVIADPNVRVRLKASIGAEVIGHRLYGTEVDVLSPAIAGFYKLAGANGYVSSDWLSDQSIPPTEFVTRYVTAKPYLNVRTEPRIAPETDVADLEYGAEIQVNIKVQVNGFTQMPNKRWVSVGYLSADRPPPISVPPESPPQPNTGAKRTRIGLHVASTPPAGRLLDMVKRLDAAGKRIACMTLISDPELANRLADYTTVMYRQVWDGFERYNAAHLNGLHPWQAEDYGYDFYFGDHYHSTRVAFKAHYLKLRNETGFHPLDAYFDIGVMKAAQKDGRKVAICGDSVGTPEVDQWVQRIPALRHAYYNGHIVTLNEYGRANPPRSNVSDLEAIEWFGLRHRKFYAAVPPDCRPPLLIGETGSYDSTVFRGTGVVVEDSHKYDQILRSDEAVVGFSYWTAGQWYGFPMSSLDAALDAIERLVLEVA